MVTIYAAIVQACFFLHQIRQIGPSTPTLRVPTLRSKLAGRRSGGEAWAFSSNKCFLGSSQWHNSNLAAAVELQTSNIAYLKNPKKINKAFAFSLQILFTAPRAKWLSFHDFTMLTIVKQQQCPRSNSFWICNHAYMCIYIYTYTNCKYTLACNVINCIH